MKRSRTKKIQLISMSPSEIAMTQVGFTMCDNECGNYASCGCVGYLFKDCLMLCSKCANWVDRKPYCKKHFQKLAH